MSPDGTTLFSASSDHLIKVWDIAGRTEKKTLRGHTGSVRQLALSPNGQLLASCGFDSVIKIWEISTSKLLHNLTMDCAPKHPLTFSPDSKTLSALDDFNGWKTWDISTGGVISLDRDIEQVRYSPDGTIKAIQYNDKPTVFQEYPSGKRLFELKTTDFIFSRDSKMVVVNTGEEVQWRDLPNGLVLGSYNAINAALLSLSADKQRLVIVGNDIGGTVINLSSGQSQAIKAEIGVLTAAFTYGHTLAISTVRYDITLLNVDNQNEATFLEGHTSYPHILGFRADGKELIVAPSEAGKSLLKLDIGGNALSNTLLTSDNDAYIVAISPDRKYAADKPYTSDIHIFEVASGKVFSTLQNLDSGGEVVGFSSDSLKVAVAADNGKLSIYQVASGRELVKLIGHNRVVESVAFSSDGKLVASFSPDDRTIKLWQTDTGALVRSTPNDVGGGSLSFSPDSKLLTFASANPLSGGKIYGIRLWNASTGQLVTTVNEVGVIPETVAFTKDGQYLICGTDLGVLHIWNVAQAQVVQSVGPEQIGLVTALTLSDDNKTLATGHIDGSIKVWDIVAKN